MKKGARSSERTLKCGNFWFKCTAYGSRVVRLPREHRKCDVSHLFLHKPTVNIHALISKPKLKNEYIYPS